MARRETIIDIAKAEIERDPDLFLEDWVARSIQSKLVLGRGRATDKVPFPEYENDLIGFIEVVLGERLTEQQKQVALSVQNNQITNCQSAASIGKSWLAARIVTWVVFAMGGLCVSTAPTEGQLKEILWSEIRKCYQLAEHKLGGKCTTLTLRHNEWSRAYGFVAHDYDANAFQGKHGQKMLLILEEACGISREIDEAAEACVTGSENKLLRIGNPIQDNTPFAEACSHSHILLNAWGHPNVSWAYEIAIDGYHRLKPEVRELIVQPQYQDYYRAFEEGRADEADKYLPSDRSIPPVKPESEWDESLPREEIPGAVSIFWIERQRISKGENSPFWQSRIEGLFAEDTEASLIPRSWFRAARKRYDENPRYWDTLAEQFPPRHGLDVGDGGDDHARATWRGPVLYNCEERGTLNDRLDTIRAGEWGYSLLREHHEGAIAVDSVGAGAGALGKVIELVNKLNFDVKGNYRTFSYKTNSVENVKPQYKNRFSQDAWQLREDLMNGEIAIAPLGPIEEKLEEELSKTYWDVNAKDQIFVEEKEKTKKRLKGRSPDRRDAVIMARSISRIPRQNQSKSRTNPSVKVGPPTASRKVLKGYFGSK